MHDSIALCLAHSLSEAGRVAHKGVAEQKKKKFSCCKLHSSEPPRSRGPAQHVFPAPVPGPFLIAYLLVQEAIISSPVLFLVPLVPRAAPATPPLPSEWDGGAVLASGIYKIPLHLSSVHGQLE